MKIKTKKQLNLPQLIEWAWENEATSSVFWTSNREEGFQNNVRFDIEGNLHTSDNFNFYDTFTIEVEEEITEDTKLDLLLDHFINPYGQHYVGNIHHNRSINDILEENDELEIATNFIHILDKETKEFKLIWLDGKLLD